MNTIKLVSKLALVTLMPLLIILKFCCPKDNNYLTPLNTLDHQTFSIIHFH